MLNAQGKVAVVTGGTRGIGLGISRALVAERINVLICGRDASRTGQVAAEISRIGPGRCAGTACDVRRYDQVEALMRHAAETFGGLDILVNNAGVAGRGAVADLPLEKRHEVIDTNLPGSVDTEFGGRASGHESWRLAPSDIAQVVLHLLAHDPRSLPSRVEIRPSQPPKKG
jgi:NAD(P)-dependent dehydrogenase (short-subunit alcohol dehydrogenase family)